MDADYEQYIRLLARQLQRFYEETHGTGRHFSTKVKPYDIEVAAQFEPVYSLYSSGVDKEEMWPRSWSKKPHVLDRDIHCFRIRGRQLLQAINIDSAPIPKEEKSSTSVHHQSLSSKGQEPILQGPRAECLDLCDDDLITFD
ncbi:hypothetical protein ACHAPJ_009494 [Fusarium lateritium]